MKKYNLSAIMKKAWSLVREFGVTISEGLKKAWKEAKSMAVKFENHMDISVDGWTRELVRWTKGDYDRVYINGGSRRGEGYVDIKRGTTHLYGKNPAIIKMADVILKMEF